MVEPEFRKELTELLNKHSMDSRTQTPDYILSDLLFDVLIAVGILVGKREEWHGRRG